MNLVNFFKGKRVFTATVFIAVTIASIVIGSWFFALYIMILIVLGVDEFIKLLRIKDIYPARELIYIFSVIFLALAVTNHHDYFIHVVIAAVITTFIRLLFRPRKVSINDISATLLGIFYAGLLPVHFVLIRNIMQDQYLPVTGMEVGAGYVLLTMMSIWTSDIGAYFIGKKYGKRLLSPVISPKKTVEGAIGGSISGILMSVLMGFIVGLNIVHSLILGVIIITAAQLGDLCESQIKRDIGVKDSGDLLPGHGGVLDRTDSYILTAPAAFYYLNFIVFSGLF